MTRKLTFLILALLALISGPGWGQTRETKTLTFALTSNPGGWPTDNSTTLTNYTYTLDGTAYTFALKNVKCNSGYLMMTSTAVLGLPAIENYKLTKVVATNSGSCSTSTKVGISSSSSSASYISGGEIQTWSTTSSTYTYNLSGTDNNTMYYLYVTNKNAQVTELTLTYEGGTTPTTELVSLAVSGTPIKTTYEAGEEFDPAGLVVTGTYDDTSTAEITSGITWTVTPSGTLTVGTTSVSVTATVDGITSPAYTVNDLTVTAALPKITITDAQVIDFTNSYKEYTWTANNVSGKMFAYKTNGMQFNTSKDGYYVYNTDPIPGNICSIKMTTHSSGTEREWKVSVGTSQITSISGDEGTEPTKNVAKAGTTWAITGSNQYFCLVDKSGASNISEIVITYEATTNPVIKVVSTEVNLAYDATSGSIPYTISNPVDGVELEASLEEGATWITELIVGDESITINTTANDSYDSRSAEITLSYEDAEEVVVTVNQAGKPAPSITCANITDVPYEGVTDEEADVTFNNAEGWNPSITYDGTVVTAASLSENTVTYSVSKNTGSTDREGSFTITLSKEGEEDVTKQVSVTQKHFVIDYAELPFSYDGDGSGTLPTGLTQNGLGTYSSFPKMKFDGEGDYLILKINENPGTLTFDIKGNPSTGSTISGTFTVQASIDGEEYIDVASYSDFGSTISTKTITDLASDVRYIKWIYTSKTSGNVALGAISLTKEVAKYTVTIAEGIQHGEVNSVEKYFEGATVQLTVKPDPNYGLVSLTITKTEGGTATGIEPVLNAENGKYEFAMPAYDITVSATFGKIATYTRITSIDQLIVGRPYIIVGKKDGKYYTMGSQGDNNRPAIEIDADGTTARWFESDILHEFFISGDAINNHYSIYDELNQNPYTHYGFLYAASKSDNHLKTEETLDGNGKWTIGFDETGAASIVAQGENTHNVMQFNSSNTLFSCYASSSQSPVYIYMKDNPFIYNIFSNTYINGDYNIPSNTMFTLYEEAKMEVTGNINSNGFTFSMMEGTQLIHNNNIYNGWFYCPIIKYAESETNERTGWNLVALPINDYNMAAGTTIPSNGDLYSYDESIHFWINEKPNNPETYIPLQLGKGYLFALPEDSPSRFGSGGTLQPSNVDLDFPLSYTETLESGKPNVLKGFNLVGNPFTCNAYVDMPFMVLDETGSTFIPGNVIKPGDAILVQATPERQEITFTRKAPTKTENRLDISVSQNRGSIIDNARIRFGEGCAMNKFYLNENGTRVYIPQNDEEFAVVSTSSTNGELPVNFKAAKNGTYTITVNAENVDAEYLHLIDNKTGMDIDLLASTGSASYTFEAKTSDYASRFKLVFGVNNADSTGSASNFAYMSDGNLVIDNIEGQATLQIVDELGRVISTETVNGSYNKTLNLKAGLYILNLNGMTQKIVVK